MFLWLIVAQNHTKTLNAVLSVSYHLFVIYCNPVLIKSILYEKPQTHTTYQTEQFNMIQTDICHDPLLLFVLSLQQNFRSTQNGQQLKS